MNINNEMEAVKRCLEALGDSWRRDWMRNDGKVLQNQLRLIIMVIDGERTFEEFCDAAGIIEVDEEYQWGSYSR